MFIERREYRKSFNSSGELYVSGEILLIKSSDVSANGILIEILPGRLLADMNDFKELLKENNTVEIYVKDLMLTGEAEISWAKLENGKMKLGLEFKDVMNNAVKLWRKRRYYRSSKKFSGYLKVDNKLMDFQGINLSMDGLAIELKNTDRRFKVGYVINLMVNGWNVKGLGKIIWMKDFDGHLCILGIRYLIVE